MGGRQPVCCSISATGLRRKTHQVAMQPTAEEQIWTEEDGKSSRNSKPECEWEAVKPTEQCVRLRPPHSYSRKTDFSGGAAHHYLYGQCRSVYRFELLSPTRTDISLMMRAAKKRMLQPLRRLGTVRSWVHNSRHETEWTSALFEMIKQIDHQWLRRVATEQLPQLPDLLSLEHTEPILKCCRWGYSNLRTFRFRISTRPPLYHQSAVHTQHPTCRFVSSSSIYTVC